MPLKANDRDVLRTLATRRAQAAADPINETRAAQWTRSNGLKPGKPMIWITEIPWHEFGIVGQLQCEDERCRKLELQLRCELYQWEHMPGDMVIREPMVCPLVISDSGFGVEQHGQTIAASEGSVLSQEFEKQIKEPQDVEKIVDPVIQIEQQDADERMETMSEAFGDIIPVVMQPAGRHWFAPWDELVRWWGVQEALLDLAMRPEMVHAAMARLVHGYVSVLDQYEAANLLALNNHNNRIGSGGYGYCDELPGDDYDPDHVKPMNMWGGATAQIFSEVSPPMHEEFALQYEKRWLKRFGLNYYGCCEPLHKKIDILRRHVPRLRKVSMSPWVDMEQAADVMGDSLVFSYKPNPAVFAGSAWDPAGARAQLQKDMEIARGCIVEVIMKDISTVSFEPQRLHEWGQIAAEVCAQFA